MKSIAVVGASGGIGAAVVEALARRNDVQAIHATYFQSPAAGSIANISGFAGKVSINWSELDATDDEAVAAWMLSIGEIDWLINCAGMLHTATHGPEKSIASFDSEHFAKSVQINTLPTLLLAKHAKAALKESSQAVFVTISARVGSISDNRLGGWYSYRASKAALNMVLKCLSIEWERTAKNIRVAALHPGTTDSRLSKPFQKNVPENKLFSCEKTAGLLVSQIQSLQNKPSGIFIAYDGEEIPW